MSGARDVAVLVLLRVFEDEAYAAAALSTALDESGLSPRDRGLATELVYGVLRTERHLTRRIQAFGKPKESDRYVLCHLLVGAYQLEFLDRVPARAAVHEAVESVSRARGRAVGGFVNAILRRIGELAPEARLTLSQAIVESTPSWLFKRLCRVLGEDAARALLTEVRDPAPTLRLREGQRAPAWFADATEPLSSCPFAFRFTAGGDPRRYPEFEQGCFVVQELGAQLVGRALGVLPGERVLDVCAGRGQKTALLAELVGPGGRVVATDLHEHKLSAQEHEFVRLGLAAERRVWDWTKEPPPEWRGSFDRVLVDAPCTGSGTLRRRPEILRRLGPEDPERLGALQASILGNAALALRPGGTLVFATCSVLPAEAEQVLASVAPLLAPRPFGPGPVSSVFSPEASATRLLPDRLGSDGYFVASLARTEAAG